MKPFEISSILSVSPPTLHPDASRLVVSVQRPDLVADRYVGQLWSVQLDGSLSKRMSRGTLDTAPQFSPDGSTLAFLRQVDDRPQLAVMDADGGECLIVTAAPLGVGQFRWSPDSASIAFLARVPEHGRYGTVEGLGAGAEPPRRFTTLKYRSNGIGYTTDRRSHVFIVAVPDLGGEPAYPAAPVAGPLGGPVAPDPSTVPVAYQLTRGDVDHTAIAFTPDGTRIAVVAARHASRDTDLAASIATVLVRPTADPAAVAAAPEMLVDVAPTAFGITALGFAADGVLYFLANDLGPTAVDFVGRGTALYLLEAAPGATPRRLTDPATVDLGEPASQLTVTASTALVQDRRAGRVDLLEVDRHGVTTVLSSGEFEITGHDRAGGATVATFTGPATHGEAGVVDAGAVHPLTDWSGEADPLPATELTITARDGHPVHGWVVAPRGAGPHPVLLVIHGGPFAQFSVSLFDEAQVYAAAGYAVLLCNPRGAAGYGEAHARAIRGRMGTDDLGDVLDFLDGAVAATDALDGHRVGIMGGSYGGYLTAWAVAHDHRFTGAIVERGFLDPVTFVGTSDIGSFFGGEYTGSDPERVAAQSPQAKVGRVTTPTLVIHSADDLRCPLEQGERYYAALLHHGVDAELLVFPGENHELSRSGRPRHRVQRFTAILAWWDRHLPVAGGPGHLEQS
ncbi:MAG: S9 family peptidase [Burkholderiaceae bacterium]|nr:S9 family peptidase [Microbacteriaceae bacterium]